MKKLLLVLTPLFLLFLSSCQSTLKLDYEEYVNFKDYSIDIDGAGSDWSEIAPSGTDKENDSKSKTDLKAFYSFISTENDFYFMADTYSGFVEKYSTLEIKSDILYKNGHKKELGFNLYPDGTYACFYNDKSVEIPGGRLKWGEVIEFMLPVRIIKDAIGIEPSFVNIWIENNGGWVDFVE